jgi:hypothetical protein
VGHAARLLPGLPDEALWDTESQDQARADQIRSLTLTQGEGRGEGGHEPGRHLWMPGLLELGKLPVSGEIRFANGLPLAPPSPPRGGGEGHASRLLLVRSAEDLWHKDNQDQPRADQIRPLALTKGEGRGEGGHEPGRHLRMPGLLELGKLPVSGQIRFASGFPLAPWRLT